MERNTPVEEIPFQFRLAIWIILQN